MDNAFEKPAQQPLWTRDFLSVVSANFLLFCGFNMLPVLLPMHFRNLGAPEYLLGLVAGVYTVATICMRPLVGATIDRFGRRGVLTLGLIIMGLASIAYVVFPLVSLVLVIRFIQGLGWAMANTASPTVASDVIPQARFAEGMSWFTQGNAFASIIGPGLSLYLFSIWGADVSVLVSAGFFFLALLFAQLIRYRKILLAKQQEETKEAILKKESPAAVHEVVKWKGIERFIEKRSLIAAATMFFVTFCYGSVVSFVALMAEAKGIEGIVFYFPLEALSIFLVRPIIGRRVDRIGYRIPAFLGLTLLAISMFILFFCFNTPTMLLAAVFQGSGYAICYSTFQTMAVKGIETNRRGTATATFYVGFDGGMGLGAVIAGFLAATFGYASIYAVYGFMPFIALAVLYVAKFRKEKERS